MPVVPLLRPREVVKAFGKLGWQVARQRGSHIILTKPGHIATRTARRKLAATARHIILTKPGHTATLSVPDHPQVARGTLRSLIAKAGVSVEEFWEAL